MKEKGFLFLPNNIQELTQDEFGGEPQLSFVRWSDVTRSIQNQLDSVSVDELKEHLIQFPVENLIAVLPPSSVSMLSVEAPTKKARQLKQAMPFLVEELSIQEPDQVLLVSDYKIHNNKVNVTTVDKSLLTGVLSFLQTHDLDVSEVFSIEQLLPVLNQQLLIILDGSNCYISSEYQKPICVPTLQLSWALKKIIQSDDKTATLNVKLVLTKACDKEYSVVQEEIEQSLPGSEPVEFYPERVDSIESYLAALAGAAANDSAILQNLLVGEFKPQKKNNTYVSVFVPTIVFAVMVLCFQLSLSLYNGWQYQQKAQQLQADIYSTVKKAIPGARIEKLRGDKALRSRIKQALSSGSQESSSLAIEKVTGDIISALTSFKSDRPYVQRLSYRSNTGETQLELHANSFAQVDQLKNALDKTGYLVTVGSVTNDNGLFKGRITLQAKEG
ncbi:type II secretion system protein GspL [Litoribacillus peritrichatus]|uniref:Type II secretion system protein L n=1 Tax=Litoribacillus peritrichatus TaxID=718191 RepID=A0ABP7MG54_9GAMM